MTSWPTEPLANLWSHLSREDFSAPSLEGDRHVDIAIVGGGIGGVSTALALVQRGAEVVLLEAVKAGEGATGRSNGQIIPTLTRHDPNAILDVYGEGATVFEHSPVVSMERSGENWKLRTPAGTVFAKRVVLVTAAYTGDLWPGLAREIVPVVSYQLATPPLGYGAAERILPFNHSMSDSHIDLRYFRKDRQGRLITGGALAFQFRAPQRLASIITKRLKQTFPDFAWEEDFEFFWSGRIAMTLDRLARLHRSDDGLTTWIGCNGRGLALSVAMGQVMADATLGVADNDMILRPSALAKVPLHALVRRVTRLALGYYRLKDLGR